ncbi:hypothetical protein A3724_00200 [Alcanivorax sp. HI0033]|nr:hypothetical protein A3714_14170 [Alcanivorax sp. HI0007]KZX68552.1 hypothetical protein A3713_02170 [Alcanivorax sp. HI0003]KZX77229.1 hypothetical protein A3716_09330 [Alcanivorax sp. HI0011]KZX92426.1 hypothetical protein A3717_04175 [Alcanivorax sp. HI0013]KZY10063.1 hypothetical protein A3724_00200 [Alcanivorax sp. HI0033]
MLLIVITLTVMALDGARLYSLRSDMQAQVNVAAQAAAGAAQACGGQAPSTVLVQQRALAAAVAQGFEGSDQDLNVQLGVIADADSSGVVAFEPVNLIERSNAVLVSYTRTEPISMLLPQSVFGGISLSVNAAVRKEVVATVSAAGGTVGVGGDATLLGSLLGVVLNQPGFSLDPTDLSSLENATVQLGDLLTATGVNDLVDLLDLDASELAAAIRDVGTATAPVADLLDGIVTAQGIDTIKVGDIISVVENASVPASSEFPVYDLVISLVLNLAEQQQAGAGGLLSLPLNINNLSVPLIANINTVDLGLNVGEPPTVAVGPARQDEDGEWVTRFYAPDVTLQLSAQVELLPINLGPLLSLSLADLTVPLAVNAGGGEGQLISADCARGTSNSVEFGVNLEREVARIVTGRLTAAGELQPERLEANVGRLSLLSGLLPPIEGILYLNAEVDGEVPGIEETVFLDPRYDLYCDPIEGCDQSQYNDLGDGLSGLDLEITVHEASLLRSSFGLINLTPLLKPILDPVLELLSNVISSLAEGLINPLLRTLGVGLGGISVNVSAANQDGIQLIENIAVEEPEQ